jgi:ribonuclease R
VSELGSDYFQFDNIKHQMLGERTGQRFRLGDRVRVRLVRADLESNRIDFVLAGDNQASRGRTGTGKRSGGAASRPVVVKASLEPARPVPSPVKAASVAKAKVSAKKPAGGVKKSKPAKAEAKPAGKKATVVKAKGGAGKTIQKTAQKRR